MNQQDGGPEAQYAWEHVPAGVFCWHYHHDVVVEIIMTPLSVRAEVIRNYKRTHEQETRLRLMRPVRGKLPEQVIEAGKQCYAARVASDKLREGCNKASEACKKAWVAGDKEWQAYKKARKVKASVACENEWVAYDKAREVYDKLWEVFEKALCDNSAEIESLHAQECPDCPWDGRTIFPKRRVT